MFGWACGKTVSQTWLDDDRCKLWLTPRKYTNEALYSLWSNALSIVENMEFVALLSHTKDAKHNDLVLKI